MRAAGDITPTYRSVNGEGVTLDGTTEAVLLLLDGVAIVGQFVIGLLS